MKPDQIIKKNELAPHDGVLLDEASYRFYQNQISALEVYERHQKESQVVGETSNDIFKGILIGFGAGIVGALALEKIITH